MVLTEPIDEECQRFVDLLADVLLSFDVWPTTDYVERTLSMEGIDFDSMRGRLPRVQAYGLAWSEDGLSITPRPEARIGLTVAGMTRTSSLEPLTTSFLHVLGYLTHREANLQPQPTEVVRDETDSDDLCEAFRDHLPRHPQFRGFPTLDFIYELLAHEPPTWSGWTSKDANGVWTFALLPRLRPYRDAVSVIDYVSTIEALHAPPATAPRSEELPPLALPAALDFLDAVWRNVLGVPPLFARRSYQFDAKLAMTCTTADEFDSRMTALADVFANLQIPNSGDDTKGDGPLLRLERFITGRLDVAPDRIQAAVQILRAAVTVRAKGQHSGRSDEVVGAYRTLGLSYPPSDFDRAWAFVQRRSVDAVDAIREELQAADSPDR